MASSKSKRGNDRETGRYRVLYVSTYADTWGGGEFSFLGLLKNLDKQSFSPEVLLLAEGEMEGIIRNMGITVESHPFFNPDRFLDGGQVGKWHLAWKLGLSSLLGTAKIHTYIKKRRIDLVHAQCWKSSFTAGTAARMAGVPMVRHERTLSWHGPVDVFCSALATHIIAISEAVADKFKERVSAKKISVIKNGVDLQQFHEGKRENRIRMEFGVPPDHPLIAVISQLIPWKGHMSFLEAASIVHQSCPTARFLIVGQVPYFAPPDYGEKLKRRAKELNISEAVIFTGYRKDIPAIMADIDILAVPSLDEPFGRVAIEAMASGRPVVAAKSGGLPEIVEDKITGLLVPPEEPKIMADALLSLIRDQRKAEDMGRAARARAEELFSVEGNARRTEELYLQILSD